MDWNDFLSERDRQLLSRTAWTKRRDFGLGERPALLVIDDYYDALGLPRAPLLDIVGDWPSACGDVGWDAVDRTVPLVAAARRNEVPVIYFTSARRGARHTRDTMITEGSRPGGVEQHGIVSELAPEPDELVIEKVGPSGFHATALDFHLRALDRDTLLVCGESTSGCVRATVVDAYQRGYRIGVVADCCFDRLEASHWISLFDMRQKYADLIDSQAALSAITCPH
jgi:nicotinamidase-related amidase